VADLLTEREMQVLHLMSHGHMNRQIARIIGGITEDAVKTHCRKMFKKLQVTDRPHAVRRGFELGLLQPHTDPNAINTPRRVPPPETSLAAAMRVANPQKQLFAALQSLGWTPPSGGRRG
jgi:DNA-binding CsgD family transcriptional regulator